MGSELLAGGGVFWQSEASANFLGGLPKRQNLDNSIVLRFSVQGQGVIRPSFFMKITTFAKTCVENQRYQLL